MMTYGKYFFPFCLLLCSTISLRTIAESAPTASHTTKNIAAIRSAQEYKKLLSDADKQGLPVVIKVEAEWCGPCKQMKKPYARVAQQYDGKVLFATIDRDVAGKEKELNSIVVKELKIEGLPTLYFYANGSWGTPSAGGLPEELIKIKIEEFLKTVKKPAKTGLKKTVEPAATPAVHQKEKAPIKKESVPVEQEMLQPAMQPIVIPAKTIEKPVVVQNETKKETAPQEKKERRKKQRSRRAELIAGLETLKEYEAFLEKADASDKPVIIKVYADWCHFCQETKALYQELSKTYKNKAYFGEINIDTNDKELAKEMRKQNINGLPTFIYHSKNKHFTDVGFDHAKMTAQIEQLIESCGGTLKKKKKYSARRARKEAQFHHDIG